MVPLLTESVVFSKLKTFNFNKKRIQSVRESLAFKGEL